MRSRIQRIAEKLKIIQKPRHVQRYYFFVLCQLTEFIDSPNHNSPILLIHRILGWVLPEAGQEEGKQSTLILSRLMVEFNRQYAHYYNKKENSEESLSKMKDQIRKEFGTIDLKKIAEQLETP